MPRPESIPLEEWRTRRHRPGTVVRISGQYVATDGSQVTCVRGERLPPTPRPRMSWRLSDQSRGLAD